MERLVALAAGVSGIAAFLATLWAMLLERRLDAAGKRESDTRKKILELESRNSLAELALSEAKKRLVFFENKELRSQKDGMAMLVCKARKAISICTPEIDEPLEAALKRTKAKARVITAQPHQAIGRAQMRASNSIDLALILLDGTQGYLLESNRLARLPKERLKKAIQGFETLWESAQP